jgi:hypothetical protein
MEFAQTTHLCLVSTDGKMVKYIDPSISPEQLASAWSGLRRAEIYNLSFIPTGQDVSDDCILEFMHIYDEA